MLLRVAAGIGDGVDAGDLLEIGVESGDIIGGGSGFEGEDQPLGSFETQVHVLHIIQLPVDDDDAVISVIASTKLEDDQGFGGCR